MSTKQNHDDEDNWEKIIANTKALINLVDPNRKRIGIQILAPGLIRLMHKRTHSSISITSTTHAIADVTYFVNNDPAKDMPLET